MMTSDSFHSLPIEDVLGAMEVSPEQGLSEEEIQRRFERYGRNKLREVERRSGWRILLDQFKSVVILVLVVAGVLALASGQFPEGIAIAAVLCVNAGLGFVTEWRALRSMEALQEMEGDFIRVRRGGHDREIDSEQLVPGDIVVVEAGDIVPADVRLIEANNLRVREAALTGESVPVRKTTGPVEEDAPLAERDCLLFKGTTIAEGSGQGVVVGTGMETELGHISELAESAEKEVTPLQRRLDRLGRRLAWITLTIAALIAGVGLLAGQETLKMIETAIALGVAAIPEGLPIVATIALARGLHLMAQRNVLIKRLPAVETLGATQTVFTDKTGTLTLNRMTVQRVITPARAFEIAEEERGSADPHPLLRRIIEVGVLCNNAYLLDEDDDRVPEEEQGDPTETALLRVGLRFEIDRRELLEQKPEEREVAFDADRMMMATYHRGPGGLEVAVKGAPEAVLDACSRMAAEGAEEASPLEKDEREQWIQRAESLAGEGLRLLAVADRGVESTDEGPYEDLRFLGLVAMEDPPRKKVREAVRECRAAGIRVVMVTGDKPATAAAIAGKTGLTDEEDLKILHGSELTDPDEMSEQQRQAVFETTVFARVSPAQKLHLVKLMQERDLTVAMTGDGVNDAPALKKADIGVAMGQRGTDVARQAADMVLRDDAFSSIVAAVRQGRIIFGNIRQSVMFMLCTNVAEVIAVAAAAAAGGFSTLPIPLLPLQILYLNVITDVFPALALGMGKGEPDVMEQPPRPSDEPVLTSDHWSAIGGWSMLLAACVLGSLSIAYYGLGFDQRHAVTISFLTLAFGKLWFVFNLRRPGSSFFDNAVIRNPYVAGAILLCILLLLAAAYLPGLSDLLKTVHPTPAGWLVILGASLVPFFVGQILRGYQKRAGSHRGAE